MSDEIETRKFAAGRSRKLIIYSGGPVSSTWADRFGFEAYREYGFRVEFWTTRDVFFTPEQLAASRAGSKDYLFRSKDLIEIRSFDEFEERLRAVDADTLFWVINRGPIESSSDTRDLDLLNGCNIKYIDKHLLPYHVPTHPYRKMRYYGRELKRRRYNSKRKPVLVLGTGRLGRTQVRWTFPNRFVYKSVPSLDVLWEKKAPEVTSKYAVYVDEAVQHAPDDSLMNHDSAVCDDVEGFYGRLNCILRKVEDWLGIPVVVGASNKYHYVENPFGDREIVVEKTQNLIQHAEIVIGHCSAALMQAIVDNKAVMMLAERRFAERKQRKIFEQAPLFGTKPIWTEQLTKAELEEVKNHDVSRYRRTRLNYLREDEVAGGFVENVVEALHGI